MRRYQQSASSLVFGLSALYITLGAALVASAGVLADQSIALPPPGLVMAVIVLPLPAVFFGHMYVWHR